MIGKKKTALAPKTPISGGQGDKGNALREKTPSNKKDVNPASGKVTYGKKWGGSPFASMPTPPPDPLTEKAVEYRKFISDYDPFNKNHQARRKKWEDFENTLQSKDKDAHARFIKYVEKWDPERSYLKEEAAAKKEFKQRLISLFDNLLGIATVRAKGPKVIYTPWDDDPA